MPKQPRKTTAQKVREARRALVAANDECERMRSEAQWCHGYRTKGGDNAEMREKESKLWRAYEVADAVRNRALTRYTRLIRQQERERGR